MAVKGVLRNIVYVQDMAKMVAFYRDILGLPINYPHLDDYSNAFWVEFQAGVITLCLHAGGNPNVKPHAPKIVFEVEDIDLEHQRLSGAGVKMAEIATVAPQVRSADGWDSEGNYFSIDYHEA
jgi:predicted enzyme related to lactoylglutathione lyase